MLNGRTAPHTGSADNARDFGNHPRVHGRCAHPKRPGQPVAEWSPTGRTASASTFNCRLTLPLLRVVENATDGTWRNVRYELDRMQLATGNGRVAQRSATTTGQKSIFATLKPPRPPDSSPFSRSRGCRPWRDRRRHDEFRDCGRGVGHRDVPAPSKRLYGCTERQLHSGTPAAAQQNPVPRPERDGHRREGPQVLRASAEAQAGCLREGRLEPGADADQVNVLARLRGVRPGRSTVALTQDEDATRAAVYETEERRRRVNDEPACRAKARNAVRRGIPRPDAGR